MLKEREKNEGTREKIIHFRQRLKQFPALVYLKRDILDGTIDRIKRIFNKRSVGIIESFPLYAPGSAGSYKDLAQLTVLTANQIFPFMNRLIEATGKSRLAGVVQAESFYTDPSSKECAQKLKLCFDKYGSDKSTNHNYHLIYGSILKNTSGITAVLEVGLGTNHTDVVSNMGRWGRPGASLRAFRDALPNARIFGADVDKRILFEEERIKTFYVDQTDPKSFDELSKQVGENFDLIIDDGLHAPNANIATLTFALGKLKHGGWLVIEDINPNSLPVWHVIAALLPPEYKPQLVSTQKAYVFLVEKG